MGVGQGLRAHVPISVKTLELGYGQQQRRSVLCTYWGLLGSPSHLRKLGQDIATHSLVPPPLTGPVKCS
jgi:hypothetical protein